MTPLNRAFAASLKILPGERAVVATITTDTVDRYGEVILPKGIDLKAYKKNPVVLWCHDSTVPPIGRCDAIEPTADERGLVAKVIFADTEFASELFKLYQDEFLKSFSVGLMSRESDYGSPPTPAEIRARPELAGCRRMYRKTSMHEFSACSVGVNPDALAVAVAKGLSISEAIRKSIANPPTEAPALPSLQGYRTLDRAADDARRAVVDRIDLLRGKV